LFWGLDLVKDPVSKEPMTNDQLRHIVTLLKNEGVLMGSTGLFENILKIRPPLIFSRANADKALEALETVFSSL
jgi:4-aminobutyrate aminotransferase-like enzyme